MLSLAACGPSPARIGPRPSAVFGSEYPRVPSQPRQRSVVLGSAFRRVPPEPLGGLPLHDGRHRLAAGDPVDEESQLGSVERPLHDHVYRVAGQSLVGHALENSVADEVVGRDVDKWSAQRGCHGLFGEPARCDELGGLPREVRVERRFDHGERGTLQPIQDHRTRLPLDAAAQRRRATRGRRAPAANGAGTPGEDLQRRSKGMRRGRRLGLLVPVT